MEINVEKILIAQKLIDFLNSQNLSEIDFIYNGEKLDFSPEEIKEWKFIGLNNLDFLLHKLEI
jgi:hypothetical protein